MIKTKDGIASIEGSRMELMAEYMAITDGLVTGGFFTKKEVKLLFKMGLPGCKNKNELMTRFIMTLVESHMDEIQKKESDEYDTLFN